MRKPTSTTTGPSSSTTTPCCTKVGLKRGPWTPEEDELLSNYINKDGEGRWRTLPKRAGLLRCGKSCRLRWMNYLRPSVKRGQIAPDEEDLILRLHRLLGNRWSLIAGRIPGRTDNEIKNYWNTHLSKKLINQGIDPRTHKPLTTTDFQQLQSASVAPATTTPATNDLHHHHHHPISSIKALSSPPPPLVIRGRSEASPNDTSPHGLELDAVNGNQGLVHGFVIDHEEDQFQAMINNNAGMLGGASGNNNFVNLGDLRNQHSNNDEMNYSCGGEDVFSSFLNSLINEDDVFINNSQQLQQTQLNHLPQMHHHHSMMGGMISSTRPEAFEFDNRNGIGGGWDPTAALVSSSSGNAVYAEQKRFISEHGEQGPY